MALEQFDLILQSSTEITPKLRHLEFLRADGKPLNFIPGQFMTLLLKNSVGELKRRSYSLANAPGSPSLGMAISYVDGGIASETLFNLKQGESLKAMGPAGRLIFQEDPEIKRYILIGTGTGIAPYRAMLSHISERFSTRPHFKIELILGAQYLPDLLYAADFLAFSQKNPRFQFHAALSRETSAMQPHEQKGHIQTYFDALSLHPTDDVVYLCGNPNMIDDSFKILTEKGFESAHVRREKYISSN
ncbi:MAG: FAD-binding oxidoreductase [Gammaproteobacteria bacterium]|nr:FAD-binding oxidoreductase [Gammaproteobacteria bacterium]